MLHHYENSERVNCTWYRNTLHVLETSREQPVRATLYYTGALGTRFRDEVLLELVIIEDRPWPEPRALDLSNVDVWITAAKRLMPRQRKLRWFHQR